MTTPSNTPKRTIVPIIILVACAAAIIYFQMADIEGNYRGPFALLSVIIALILLAIWVVALSGLRHGLRWKIVGIGFLCLVLFGVGIGLLTRRDGSYSGAGVPRLVWRWTPVHTVPPLILNPATVQPVSLVQPSPDDFPQFLGSDRDSRIRGAHLGRDWAKNPPVLLWHHSVGLGWSGFAIVGNAAITMEQRGDQESTICYNLQTGEPVWVHANTAYLIEREGGDGPRATPTISGGYVYTYGGLGNLDCLDLATGKPIWSRAILSDPSNHLRYGQASSPLIVDDKVIVTGGHARGDPEPRPAVLAFNKETGGEPIWKFFGDDASYASPSLVTLDGVRQIVCVHQNSIVGHDIANGKSLWEFQWHPQIFPKNSQALAVGADKVYCSSGYSVGSVLLHIKGTSPQAVTELWHTPLMKTEMSNVVIRDGYAYGLDDGHLVCQELSAGQKIWRRSTADGHGQILQAGDLLLVQSERGNVTLLDASPKDAVELGSFPALSDSKTCWNPPALAGHLLVVRNDREAACYRLP